MKKLFCAILMLLLCVSCFAGTLYVKAGEKVYIYENVVIDRSGSYTTAFRGINCNIIVSTHSEWWYIE